MNQFANHPLYQKHNIDSAMNSLWGFYKMNFPVLFIASFIMSLIIQYASTIMDIASLQGITDPTELIEKIKDFILPIMGLSLINLLFSTIMHYYVIYNPVDREKTILVSALHALKFFIPYLIIMILLAFAGSFAIIAGLFVFIVGAFFAFIYLMTLYLLILPTMMIEGPHIGNTIGRVFKLAHRGFWSNIGWVGVFLILLIVASVLLSAVILIPFSGSFMKAIFSPDEAQSMMDLARNPIYIIFTALANALTFPLVPIFASILYFNGMAAEEQIEMVPENPEETRVKVEDLYAKPYSEDNMDNPERDQTYEK